VALAPPITACVPTVTPHATLLEIESLSPRGPSVKKFLAVTFLVGGAALTACGGSSGASNESDEKSDDSDDKVVVPVKPGTVEEKVRCPQGCGNPKPPKTPCAPSGCDGS
jgi:hypothetical protein